ncbi:hypothetical protein [uncultured Paludibaculum sp.]|uniref:hypothetical protein n=1 Tax=uncultured Paludibaculum sp. TaxID=1765020 RepID=UPI002AAB1BC5|nr:hypothetical protein [uncultured Paludibaculum sp.]
MLDSKKTNYKATLFGLEGVLSNALSDALSRCNCFTFNQTQDQDREHPHPDIVFCSPSPDVLKPVLQRFKHTPVVVVSRLPEVDGWLDALEAGAADYCAAPFETTQLRWLLDTHARARKALAAA